MVKKIWCYYSDGTLASETIYTHDDDLFYYAFHDQDQEKLLENPLFIKEYYEDGSLYSSMYYYKRDCSLQKIFYKNGNVYKEIGYKDIVCELHKRYDENGNETNPYEYNEIDKIGEDMAKKISHSIHIYTFDSNKIKTICIFTPKNKDHLCRYIHRYSKEQQKLESLVKYHKNGYTNYDNNRLFYKNKQKIFY